MYFSNDDKYVGDWFEDKQIENCSINVDLEEKPTIKPFLIIIFLAFYALFSQL